MRHTFATDSGLIIAYKGDLDCFNTTCICGRDLIVKGVEVSELAATRCLVLKYFWPPFKPWPPSAISYCIDIKNDAQ